MFLTKFMSTETCRPLLKTLECGTKNINVPKAPKKVTCMSYIYLYLSKSRHRLRHLYSARRDSHEYRKTSVSSKNSERQDINTQATERNKENNTYAFIYLYLSRVLGHTKVTLVVVKRFLKISILQTFFVLIPWIETPVVVNASAVNPNLPY